MGVDHKLQESRVSTRVAEEVRTPIGDVFVTYEPRSAKVVVSFHSKGNRRTTFDHDNEGGLHVVSFGEGPRIPRKGDEVTQNGRTFEVEGIRTVEGNKIQIHGDNGVWEDWKEN